jgi:hypothetical protein
MANYPKTTKGSRHGPDSHFKSGVRRMLGEDRRIQARVRQELYNKLSLEERVAKLNRGGFRASKQRAKLARQMFARDNSPKAQAKKVGSQKKAVAA